MRSCSNNDVIMRTIRRGPKKPTFDHTYYMGAYDLLLIGMESHFYHRPSCLKRNASYQSVHGEKAKIIAAGTQTQP